MTILTLACRIAVLAASFLSDPTSGPPMKLSARRQPFPHPRLTRQWTDCTLGKLEPNGIASC